MIEISRRHPTPWPLMYLGQISHRIKPYGVNVLVALLRGYGTTDQKQQESPHAPPLHVISPSSSFQIASSNSFFRLKLSSYNRYSKENTYKTTPNVSLSPQSSEPHHHPSNLSSTLHWNHKSSAHCASSSSQRLGCVKDTPYHPVWRSSP